MRRACIVIVRLLVLLLIVTGCLAPGPRGRRVGRRLSSTLPSMVSDGESKPVPQPTHASRLRIAVESSRRGTACGGLPVTVGAFRRRSSPGDLR